MKKYTIIYNFTATASIEVLADTREEAFEKARANELNLADYNFELDGAGAEIGREEDVPDLRTMIQQAESIVKQADEEDKTLTLNPWPNVTTEYWTGAKMEQKTDLMDNLYWDYEADEIGFNTVNSAGDFSLSELPEIEQYEICEAIIRQGKEVHNA